MNRFNYIVKKIVWLMKTRKCNDRSVHSFADIGVRITGAENIEIGNCFSAGYNLKLQTWSISGKDSQEKKIKIKICDDVCFNDNCQISSANYIEIGKGTLLGDNVFISDNFHGNSTYEVLSTPPLKRDLYVKGAVIIGENVWIGRNVCIMPGVIIGDGCVIGANSFVNSSFEANSIIGGIPARVIRMENKT